MPGPIVTTDGFVLERTAAAADGWERLQLFTLEHGAVTAMRRQTRKPGGSPVLDLFDEAELALEGSSQGHSWFVRDAKLRHRPEGIGRSYDALVAASALARVIARNPVGPESRRAVYLLLREAFAALADGPRPDVVLFKSLYRFARDEGYPVKQEWLAELAADDREPAARILREPARDCAEPKETVQRLERRLEDYLRGQAEMAIE